MIRLITVAALFSISSAGSAVAQDAWRSPIVATQMIKLEQYYAGQGYAPTAWFRQDDLGSGGEKTFEIYIYSGDSIDMMAVCDKACTDVDLQVFDPGGNKIAADEKADSAPIGRFTAASEGLFKVRVMMVKCSAPSCAVGVKGFWKRPAKPAQTAIDVPKIMVAGADNIPKMLMGFIGFGPDSSLTKLENAAAEAGISAGKRVVGGEQIDNTMIVFKPGTDAARARDLYHKAIHGGFGFPDGRSSPGQSRRRQRRDQQFRCPKDEFGQSAGIVSRAGLMFAGLTAWAYAIVSDGR